MKQDRDELLPSESAKRRKCADVRSSYAQSIAQASSCSPDEPKLCARREEEPASSDAVTQVGDLQSNKIGGLTENEEVNESPSLLGDQNPQVKNASSKLFMASYVERTVCMWHSKLCDSWSVRTERSSIPLDRNTAVQSCVKRLLSYSLAETESPTLKLQILRSLYQIAKEAQGVQHSLLLEHLPELLASNNPFIRAQALRVLALSLITDADGKYLVDKKDNIGLFVEYTHDSSVVVRKASLHSIILLCSKGHLLTEASHKAAVVLLKDLNEVIRLLALEVISLWVKQGPEEHTNIAFLEVCKMMTDMDLSVRLEACKAFLTMKIVREDLLLQALSKKPLEVLSSNEEKELQPSSLITIPESEVDLSKCKEGLNILDRLNLGAFVHGVEDEFFEVRLLMVDVLAHFSCVSARVCIAIKEVMINLLNDDSNQVRLRAVQKLIHVAHCYGLQVNDSDLDVVQGILEDVDGAVRNAGRTLLALIQHSSIDSLKCTIKILMKLMQRNPQQENDIWHDLYELGRTHSTFVQLLTKDLLIELKACMSGDAGVDAPEYGCILFLFLGASETNTKILSLVPSQILSHAQLLYKSKSQSDAVLTTCSTASQVKMIKRYLHPDAGLAVSSDHKEKTKDYLARAARTCWNVKEMLVSGMVSRSRQVLRGCRRDMKRLLNMLGDNDQVALTTYVLHYVECINLVCQGWVHFQHKGILATASSTPSLLELACRLEFVVKCMQHTYFGHTDEQKLDLIELSIIPALWRMISMASRNDYRRRLLSDVETIQSTMKQGSFCSSFIENIQKNLLKTVASLVDVQETLRELGLSFWPRLLTINDLREMRVVLSIPQNDLEHPIEFLPNMPFSITVSILTRNLDMSSIWMRIRLESLWTKFVFLDASKCRSIDPLVTSVQIPGLSVYSKCTLVAAVYLECLGDPHEVGRGPREYLLPLTLDKLIYLMPASGALG
ncbi:hypothetical protein GOP47_0020463 [Adiantum capillus-veneris]|uniref:Integrator complex subunit 4 n=1 Tax=Adiantum capillus-veneris TaxID=13818 RepID=A0A9D4U974_ADICA|nr:hypothetical protein GOP47_0020463 [Adiantum capillus-veneris]